MITSTLISAEKCPYCIRGWIGRLVCEWCMGKGMVLMDRGYMEEDSVEQN